MFACLLRIRYPSAKLEPDVGAGAGLTSFDCFHGATVSHRLVGVSIDVVTTIGIDVFLSVGVGTGFGVRFDFGLSCLLGCGCWCSSGFYIPLICVMSVYIEASRPMPLVSTLIYYLWPGSVASTVLETMPVMRMPHGKSSWWHVSCFSSLSFNHLYIPPHYTSCSAVCAYSMFAIFAMVRCSCVSLQAC
jgi:hypothetical protein